RPLVGIIKMFVHHLKRVVGVRSDGVVRDLPRRFPESGEVGHNQSVDLGELWGERIKVALASGAAMKQYQGWIALAVVRAKLPISDAHGLRGSLIGLDRLRQRRLDFTIRVVTELVGRANHVRDNKERSVDRDKTRPPSSLPSSWCGRRVVRHANNHTSPALKLLEVSLTINGRRLSSTSTRSRLVCSDENWSPDLRLNRFSRHNDLRSVVRLRADAGRARVIEKLYAVSRDSDFAETDRARVIAVHASRIG